LRAAPKWIVADNQARVLSFLDNPDMTRIFYLAGEDKAKVKLAALVLFTLSQPPGRDSETTSAMNRRRRWFRLLVFWMHMTMLVHLIWT